MPPEENYVVLRLAEQYLIRAESRARQGKLIESISDINVIRTRAGLPNIAAVAQEQVLDAILNERRTELFTEPGHRWFDLMRLGKIDDIMSVVTPLKGGLANN